MKMGVSIGRHFPSEIHDKMTLSHHALRGDIYNHEIYLLEAVDGDFLLLRGKK